MGKRGPKPKGKVILEWSPGFAYAIGLLVTDGSLSKDGRHVAFTSKDFELIENIQKGLSISCHVGKKGSGFSNEKKYFTLQIGDVLFYQFLEKIGLMQKKSKVIKDISVPNEFIPDFLRGHLDGDGTFYSYRDPRWKSSFMFYTAFVSASKEHVLWIQTVIRKNMAIKGHITKSKNDSVYQLKYAKKESLILIRNLYYTRNVISLSRKRMKIQEVIGCEL